MKWEDKYKFVNAALFQTGWFSCVLLPIPYAVLISTLVIITHFQMTEKSTEELIRISTIASIGYLLDIFVSSLGLINFTVADGSTVYLVFIWILFASTLNWSMKFMMTSPLKATVLGLLAPIAYLGAQQFQKVQYSEPLTTSVSGHALLWGVYMLIVQKVYFGQNSQQIHER